MRVNQKRWIMRVVMLLGLAVGIGWQMRPVESESVERLGYQDADRPLGMPVGVELDEAQQSLLAWDRLRIPVATRFDAPMGSEQGAFAYNAQKFLEMNEKRGGPHLGDDLNGIGGQNTDLGDAVYAVADGLVVYAGEPSRGWGNVVIVAHRTRDGRYLQSMYAHLDRVDAVRGRLIARGGAIGTVGTAHGNYLAHLHFEMREAREVDHGPGYGHVVMNRLDPSETIRVLRGAEDDDLGESVWKLVRE